MRRYQEGGLAAAQPQDAATGYLSLLASQYQTTPEAQERAREILDTLGERDFAAEEEELRERYRETAEESRAALQQARQAVLAREYDKRRMWLAAAAGFGAPTRTGALGETISHVARQLEPQFAERDAFNIQKEEDLLGLDQALAGVDQTLLESDTALHQLSRKQATDLARSALNTLSRAAVSGGSPSSSPGGKSRDQKMATLANEWTTQGRADALKSQSELTEAIDIMSESDNISGPMVGILPKWARDLAFPESGNVQDLVETTAQRSLKAVLGGQFGQREGEMLLARTFNPRLDEKTNRDRAFRLLKMLQVATEEKNQAVAYFQTYGTMEGYEGKKIWTVDDFMPEDVMMEVEMPDGVVIEVPDHWSKTEIRKFYDESRDANADEPERFAVGGYAKKAAKPKDLKVQYYQEGGPVKFDDLEENVTQLEDVEDELTSGDMLQALGLTAGGTATGLTLEEIGTRLQEMKGGFDRPSEAQQIMGAAVEKGPMTPSEMATDIKRAQRQGVPEVVLDVSGPVAQEIGKRALMSSSDAGDIALEFLTERHEGSRDRITRQVEKGLRTPEFYETEQRLTDNLYSRARPLYEQAYKENAAIKTPPFWKKMFESKYGKLAIKNALEFMRESGQEIGKKNVAGWVEKPSLEFLDQVKRGYDQQISTELQRNGYTPRYRIMKEQRSRLVSFLDNPDNVTDTYAKARAQYKGDLETLQALETGRGQYYRMPAEEARQLYNGMSWSEKQALRTGMAQKLYEIIYAPSTDINAARRLVGSPEMQRRLEILFDKPREFRIFKAALEREMDMWEKGKKVIASAERGRTSRGAQQAIEMDNPLSNMKEAISRGPLAFSLRMIGRLGLGSKGRGLTENQADEIVEMIMTSDPAELDKLATQLEKGGEYARTRQSRRGKAALVGTGVGAALAAIGLDDDDEDDE